MSITIPPYGSYVVNLRFVPLKEGVRSGSLTFTSGTPGSPHTVPLQGLGGNTPNALRDTDNNTLLDYYSDELES